MFFREVESKKSLENVYEKTDEADRRVEEMIADLLRKRDELWEELVNDLEKENESS